MNVLTTWAPTCAGVRMDSLESTARQTGVTATLTLATMEGLALVALRSAVSTAAVRMVLVVLSVMCVNWIYAFMAVLTSMW